MRQLRSGIVLVATAAALALAGQAQACRNYVPPTVTYHRWFEVADRVVLARVVSVGEVQETGENGRPWTRPVMTAELIRVLRGGSSPDRISVGGGDVVVTICHPTLHSEISGLTVGDKVFVMLNENDVVFGLMKADSQLTHTYLARLTRPAE